MTQTEWLSSSDPESLLRWLTGTPGSSPEGATGALAPARRPSGRKLRLFACAVSRLVGGRPDEPIGATEAWADGGDPKPKGAWVILDGDCAETAASIGYGSMFGPVVDRQAQKATILRDIVGDPWGPVSLCGNRDHGGVISRPGCACRRLLTPEVLSLATAAYGQRGEDGTLDNARLAVLSDALEEAGCDHAGLLSHLRSPGPHYRGMWSLDLVLGKE